MPAHLFVYGTLHPDLAPQSILATVRKLHLIGAATIRGRKLSLGDQFGRYPGLVIGPAHTEEVSGHVFALPEDATTLAALDHYEDFRPLDLAGSLFAREPHQVMLADGSSILCWVYVYNRYSPK